MRDAASAAVDVAVVTPDGNARPLASPNPDQVTAIKTNAIGFLFNSKQMDFKEARLRVGAGGCNRDARRSGVAPPICGCVSEYHCTWYTRNHPRYKPLVTARPTNSMPGLFRQMRRVCTELCQMQQESHRQRRRDVKTSTAWCEKGTSEKGFRTFVLEIAQATARIWP